MKCIRCGSKESTGYAHELVKFGASSRKTELCAHCWQALAMQYAEMLESLHKQIREFKIDTQSKYTVED